MRRLIVFILLALWLPPLFAGVSAHLDRTRISLGEDVRLIVQVDGQANSQPDFRALGKDFEILSNASGMQMRLVNGRKTAQSNWTVTMRPRRTGTISIAPIAVGNQKTEVLKLEVAAAGKGGASQVLKDNSIFLETQISTSTPYVQQMVVYTVRVFHSVKILEGELRDPELSAALVRQLEPDKKYSADRNGKRYRVIERRYLIYPLDVGEMVIPEAVLSAKIPDKSRKGTPFNGMRDPGSIFGNDPFFSQVPLAGFLGNARSIQLKGAAQVMKVRSPSGESQGRHWLPATKMNIYETFKLPDEGVKVGEPVTRAITIRAEGLTGEQIPDVEISAPAGARVYPDKASHKSRDLEAGVVGEKSQRFAFVPSQPGKLVLPAVKVQWWDVSNEVERVAELPERVVNVAAAAITADPVTATGSGGVAGTSEGSKAQQSAVQNAEKNVPTLWKWLVFILAATVIGMLAWVIFLSRKITALDTHPARQAVTRQTPISIAEARSKLANACKNNNPEAARRTLLSWAEAEWPENPPNGLENLSRRFRSEAAQRAIRDLEAVLFAGNGKRWDGKAFSKAIPTLPSRSRKKQSSDENLPELFS